MAWAPWLADSWAALKSPGRNTYLGVILKVNGAMQSYGWQCGCLRRMLIDAAASYVAGASPQEVRSLVIEWQSNTLELVVN